MISSFAGTNGDKKECKKEITPWSACSVSCGMGVSIRVTNDNEDCQPVQQRRLCLVRPCELNDKHLVSRVPFTLYHTSLKSVLGSINYAFH